MSTANSTVDAILSRSGRDFPQKTQLLLYWTPLIGHIGVRVKLPKAKAFVDLGPLSIIDRVVKVPFSLCFLAYAREDKSTVGDLYQRLLDNGILPWLDTKDIYGGQQWRLFRDKAIREADHCVLFLSKLSVKKIGEFQREIRLALDEVERRPEDSNYLIPVRLDDCEPPELLRPYNWVDIYKTDGIECLLNAVKLNS